MNRDNPVSDLEARLRPLWLAAQSGDERAYREALGLMATRLRAYFRRRMPTLLDDCEDLVQETLLAVHLQRGTYDPEFPVLAWMTAIARHKWSPACAASAAARPCTTPMTTWTNPPWPLKLASPMPHGI